MLTNYFIWKGENKEVEEIKTEKSTRKISKNDLDENAKQGNNWVSIHGRVYDLAMLKTQAPCGEMLLEHYAGKMKHRLTLLILLENKNIFSSL